MPKAREIRFRLLSVVMGAALLRATLWVAVAFPGWWIGAAMLAFGWWKPWVEVFRGASPRDVPRRRLVADR